MSCVQVQVYSESRMESPLTTAGVNSIGFFDLTPLPNRSEVLPSLSISITVEPLNNGHVNGTSNFVYREVVLSY